MFHEFLPFLQAAALAPDVDDGAVVENAVEDRRGDGDVAEGFVPLGEGLVGGKDGGGFLISRSVHRLAPWMSMGR